MFVKLAPGSKFNVSPAPSANWSYLRRVATEVVSGIAVNLDHRPTADKLTSLYVHEMHEINPWLMTADVGAPLSHALQWYISEQLTAELSKRTAADFIEIGFSDADIEMHQRISGICVDYHEAASRIAAQPLRYYVCVVATDGNTRM